VVTANRVKKLEVIGKLPFSLLSTRSFPSDDSPAKFARESPGTGVAPKLSRPEIVGLVMTRVAEPDATQMERFHAVVSRVVERVESGTGNDFFVEWADAIGNIEFHK
jgi:hypothetical protein